eukprot:Clim_evm37s195 gene=Clim_evmTU37s195
MSNQPGLILFGDFTEEETVDLLTRQVDEECVISSEEEHEAQDESWRVETPEHRQAEHSSVQTQPAKAKAKPSSWAALVKPSSGNRSARDGAAESTPTVDAETKKKHKAKLSHVGDKLLTNEIDFQTKTIIQPRGLINHGNQCYFNGILQPLLVIRPLYNLLKSLKLDFPALPGSTANDDGSGALPLSRCLVDFFNQFTVIKNERSVQSFIGPDLSPAEVYSIFAELNPNATVTGRQEDAEEVLGFMLHTLHKEMVALMRQGTLWPKYAVMADSAQNGGGGQNGHVMPTSVAELDEERVDGEWQSARDKGGSSTTIRSSGNSRKPRSRHTSTASNGSTSVSYVTGESEALEWETVGPKGKSHVTRRVDVEESPIAKIFGGVLRSTFRLPEKKPSVTFEPFHSLQLYIQSDEIRTLEQAMAYTHRKEVIEGYMHRGKASNQATKQITLEELPPILIVHLKLFVYDVASGQVQKLCKDIEFTENLEIPRSCVSQTSLAKDIELRYQLFAIVYHHGIGAHDGHYTCRVKQATGTWLDMDDRYVVDINDKEVTRHRRDRNVYLLMYQRVDTLL